MDYPNCVEAGSIHGDQRRDQDTIDAAPLDGWRLVQMFGEQPVAVGRD